MHGRVLIIDDEPAIARLIAIWLEASGYKPMMAYDGLRGIEMAKSERPDAILLDIRMPDLDGFEVNARLKSTSLLVDVPVVFLSANVHERARKRALASGATAFIEKPFESQEIIDVVNRILPGMRNGNSDRVSLAVGDAGAPAMDALLERSDAHV